MLAAVRPAGQQVVTYHQSRVSKAVDELREMKTHLDERILSNRYANLGFLVVQLPAIPEVMCNGVFQPTHDFEGNVIQELGHMDIPASWATFSLIATDDGGAAVIGWHKEHAKANDSSNHCCIVQKRSCHTRLSDWCLSFSRIPTFRQIGGMALKKMYKPYL